MTQRKYSDPSWTARCYNSMKSRELFSSEHDTTFLKTYSFNYTTGRTSQPALHTVTSMKLSAPAGNLTNNLRPRSSLLGRFTDQLRGCNMSIRQA